ncbi:hypothetical protein CBR_g25983 [Chara braunii]|uniref:Uncharacterized protein n=1 Tax=Chara braunii TaxID=69332 RepID=A0A388L6X3_CHABU|nr:hypothetical protein CBR_g25983 [Chara braunii]|eukprot:GBG78047.1 hypothetical protein CBR_g25983 [Chara braunii]
MSSTPSISVSMSPETHMRLSSEKLMRLARPFSPCARSVRYHDGQTWIDEAAREDFDEDPWMTVVPYMNRHLDEWNDNDWKAMERVCPWASPYKFANMLEFGSLIALPDGVLQRKTLDDKGKPIRYRTSFRRRLYCEYIISSSRTWGSSQKQELVDCARHCSFLEHYPPRCLETSPQAISYCCVRLTDDGCPFARVLCVASSDKSRKLMDVVVLVSRNEIVQQDYKFKPVMSRPDVDGRSDFVRAGQVTCLELFYEVEEKVFDIRDCTGNSLARPGGFVRMKYISVFSENATVDEPQIHVYGSSMNAMYGFCSRPRPRETPYVTSYGRVVRPCVEGKTC